MTTSTLARAISNLPGKERVRLFDRLGPALEDYFLAKIAQDRLRKASRKRIPWEEIRP